MFSLSRLILLCTCTRGKMINLSVYHRLLARKLPHLEIILALGWSVHTDIVRNSKRKTVVSSKRSILATSVMIVLFLYYCCVCGQNVTFLTRRDRIEQPFSCNNHSKWILHIWSFPIIDTASLTHNIT